MKLELTDDRALVLFEWLARLVELDAFPVEGPAEEQVDKRPYAFSHC